MSLPPKILKSYPPDVTVTVGSGDAEQQFKCYKVILCHASDYFDVMFSTDFVENSTSHVKFPDKDLKWMDTVLELHLTYRKWPFWSKRAVY